MAEEQQTNSMATPFKMKGYPYPGTSPVKQDEDLYESVKDTSNVLTKSGQSTDVTDEYKKKGSKEVRDAIKSGSKVFKHPKTGQLTIQS